MNEEEKINWKFVFVVSISITVIGIFILLIIGSHHRGSAIDLNEFNNLKMENLY